MNGLPEPQRRVVVGNWEIDCGRLRGISAIPGDDPCGRADRKRKGVQRGVERFSYPEKGTAALNNCRSRCANFSPGLSQRPAAVLFVSDPDQNVELPVDLLRRCYRLTPAEARLAVALLEGHSLKEAADSGRVTHNTAKSQLKSIFLKTDVKRQSELIRLLLNTGASCVRQLES